MKLTVPLDLLNNSLTKSRAPQRAIHSNKVQSHLSTSLNHCLVYSPHGNEAYFIQQAY